VAGDLATVENLLPSNVDPHDYQFTARDLKKLADADVVVLNGLGVDSWLERAIRSAAEERRSIVVRLADGLSTNQYIYDADEPWVEHRRLRPGSETTPPNPHIWLDPVLVEHGVSNICNALQKADPANAAGYARNTAAYVAQLQKLDEDLRTGLATLTHRDLVTDHNAFPYFARRYGLNLVGVIEEVEDIAPAPEYLARLMERIRSKRVPVLFVVPPAPPREAAQIARDLGIPVATLDTVETGPLKPSTYEDEMYRNLRTFQRYLR
jgi:zinc transport system substrate-binding protein